MPGPTVDAGMNAPIMTVYTGKRAEQVISGAIRIVAKRSFWSMIVRVAMIPGIAQAKDDNNGMKLCPESPTAAINRSITKAARVM